MKYFYIVVAASFISFASLIQADPICGELYNGGNGPFDYTNPQQETLKLVETHHFSKNVETLVAGIAGELGHDIGFTLRAFPNHHRALDAMSRLSIRERAPKPSGSPYTAMCWFERAIRFKPDDAMVRLVFSNHLLKIKKTDMALEQLLIANGLEPDNPLTAYNLGLIYLKKKDYENAAQFAQQAYKQDFPLQGLKNQLKAAGKWQPISD